MSYDDDERGPPGPGHDGGGRGRRRRGRRRRRNGRGPDPQRADRPQEGDEEPPGAEEGFEADPVFPRDERRGSGREAEGPESVEGVLFVTKDGFGFLRQAAHSYLSGASDPFVPAQVIQRYRLRPGQLIQGALGRGRRGGRRKRALETVQRVDGDTPEVAARRPRVKALTPVDPTRRIVLETRHNDATLRVIDLVTPIGFGQRYLIVAPPRVGKTVILHKLANAIGENHPQAKVIVLLVDERPEEVTDFRRTCTHAEVIASSLDMDPSAHVAVTEVVLQRVRALVEAGHDVVVLTDSLTRMSRAFNTERGRSGRTLTGGLDSSAMQKPREFFGAARSFEEGGSITNIATVLVETGSKMDQVIFEEFKGTGNAELVLNRDLADLRIFPAINVKDSGTRKEEKLRDPQEMQLVTLLRRGLMRFGSQRVMEALVEKVKKTSSNAELLLMLQKQVI